MKPLHAKPNLYAYYFEALKEIAKEHGYNLVVHGSMNRDLDLIAIPWVDDPKDEMEMINAMSNYMNGWTTEHKSLFLHNVLLGGRKTYIIQLNRGGYMNTGQACMRNLNIYKTHNTTLIFLLPRAASQLAQTRC